MSEYTTGGAGCALHPETPALAVCDRCGAYMCNACSEGGAQRLCPTCRARTGAGAFPLRRDAWTLDALFSLSWQAFTGSIGQLILGALITVGVAIVVALVREVIVLGVGHYKAAAGLALVLGMLIQYGAQGVLQLGFLDMGFDALDGQTVRIGTLFGHVGKLGRLLLQYLVVVGILLIPVALYGALVALGVSFAKGSDAGLVIAGLVTVGTLILIPLTWVMLPLVFMQYELALDDDVGAVESIRRCYALAQGKRLAILGMSLLGGLVMMSGAILCGVGALVTMPLGQVILCALFLALRNGSGLPPPVRRGNRARDDVMALAEPPGPALAP